VKCLAACERNGECDFLGQTRQGCPRATPDVLTEHLGPGRPTTRRKGSEASDQYTPRRQTGGRGRRRFRSYAQMVGGG
jgi:hypothetical protein